MGRRGTRAGRWPEVAVVSFGLTGLFVFLLFIEATAPPNESAVAAFLSDDRPLHVFGQSIGSRDKVAHLLAGTLFASLVVPGLVVTLEWRAVPATLVALTGALGIALELAQLPVAARTADMGDALAFLAGGMAVLAGVLVMDGLRNLLVPE